MKTFVCATLALYCVSTVGCAHRSEAPTAAHTEVTTDDKPGIEIDTPNARIDVGDGKGIQVESPDVDIKTSKQE